MTLVAIYFPSPSYISVFAFLPCAPKKIYKSVLLHAHISFVSRSEEKYKMVLFFLQS